MDALELKCPQSGSSARISAQYGFNCFEFLADTGKATVDVIAADDDFAKTGNRASGNGIPLLFPFPNRIRGGRFSWQGTEYHIPEELAAYNQDNAIHGFCLDRPWRVTEQGENFAVGEFQLSRDAADRLELWPADFIIEVRYSVEGAALRADIKVTNPSEEDLPWGFGTHPYFKVPLSAGSKPGDCVVEAPAAQMWELIDCLPTGKRLPVTEAQDLREGAYFDVLKLDDVLTGLEPEGDVLTCTLMDEKAGLQVVHRCSSIFRELVVFTPSWTSAICLEPYTCITDAINLENQGIDTGWRSLKPGETFSTWIEIAAGPVLA